VQELSNWHRKIIVPIKKGTRRNVWFMMAMHLELAASWIKGKITGKYFLGVLGLLNSVAEKKLNLLTFQRSGLFSDVLLSD